MNTNVDCVQILGLDIIKLFPLHMLKGLSLSHKFQLEIYALVNY